jgi:hypothetical protein
MRGRESLTFNDVPGNLQINVPLSEIEGLLFGLAMSRIEGANSKGSSGPKAELIRLK